jgi:hypothetical protein
MSFISCRASLWSSNKLSFRTESKSGMYWNSEPLSIKLIITYFLFRWRSFEHLDATAHKNNRSIRMTYYTHVAVRTKVRSQIRLFFFWGGGGAELQKCQDITRC